MARTMSPIPPKGQRELRRAARVSPAATDGSEWNCRPEAQQHVAGHGQRQAAPGSLIGPGPGIGVAVHLPQPEQQAGCNRQPAPQLHSRRPQ